jgi:hypothetical protein
MRPLELGQQHRQSSVARTSWSDSVVRQRSASVVCWSGLTPPSPTTRSRVTSSPAGDITAYVKEARGRQLETACRSVKTHALLQYQFTTTTGDQMMIDFITTPGAFEFLFCLIGSITWVVWATVRYITWSNEMDRREAAASRRRIATL